MSDNNNVNVNADANADTEAPEAPEAPKAPNFDLARSLVPAGHEWAYGFLDQLEERHDELIMLREAYLAGQGRHPAEARKRQVAAVLTAIEAMSPDDRDCLAAKDVERLQARIAMLDEMIAEAKASAKEAVATYADLQKEYLKLCGGLALLETVSAAVPKPTPLNPLAIASGKKRVGSGPGRSGRINAGGDYPHRGSRGAVLAVLAVLGGDGSPVTTSDLKTAAENVFGYSEGSVDRARAQLQKHGYVFDADRGSWALSDEGITAANDPSFAHVLARAAEGIGG